MEYEAKEADVATLGDLALVFVDRELEFMRQMFPDAPHDPFAGTLAFDQYEGNLGEIWKGNLGT